MNSVINALVFLAAFAGMEGVAYLTHKHVMHGSLWCLHESHHRPRTGWFEKNDLFAVIFSVPSILFIYLGVHYVPILLWVGLGMTAYGVAYFIFHDVIVHRRIRTRYKPKTGYMKRIVRAHWIHHACHERDGAVSFGFLYAPPVEQLRSAR